MHKYKDFSTQNSVDIKSKCFIKIYFQLLFNFKTVIPSVRMQESDGELKLRMEIVRWSLSKRGSIKEMVNEIE